MKHALLGLALVCAAVSLSGAALAFKEAGHRSIEAQAYRQLLEQDRHARCACDGQRVASAARDSALTGTPPPLAPQGTCRPGVIQTLIDHGVLKHPGRPKPEGFVKDYEDYSVESVLIHSHMPDHTMERQFHKQRQCFHFNASGGHYETSSARRFGPDGVPLGMVEDAYVECLGLADALLRNIIYDPAGSREQRVGIYSLMHMIGDSFAESHVARTANGHIVYLKPWNLRTWARYMFEWGGPAAPHAHFSDRHHQMTDSVRDYGYLIGPTDGDYRYKLEQDETGEGYRAQMDQCLRDARREFGSEGAVDWESLQSHMVVPGSCLSQSGKNAADALADLLTLVAEVVPNVRRQKPAPGVANSLVGQAPGFGERWLNYRTKHLRHVNQELTTRMHNRPYQDDQVALSAFEKGHDVRNDRVYPSDNLSPAEPKTAGIGLSSEMTSGTPLWVGYDSWINGEGSDSHTLSISGFIGWGVQLRLPVEDQIGERPVGVAFEPGLTFPVSITQLANLNSPLQVYVGVRGRIEYVGKSGFESHTRHFVSYGLGGVSIDTVFADSFWFSVDTPRIMREYSSWLNETRTRRMSWSVSAGMALDAF